MDPDQESRVDGGGPKENDRVDASLVAFEALDRECQEVLNELIADPALDRFRIEYEKLHRALRKSHEQEKRLVKKCRELNTEVVSNATKVQTALKSSQDNQATSADLRKELDRAYAMLEAASEKETKGKETMCGLREEVLNLTKMVEKGTGLSVDQENMVKELLKLRDDLQRDNAEKSDRINILETQISTMSKAKEQLAKQMEDAAHTQSKLQYAVAKRDVELDREQRRRERVEKEYKDLTGKMNIKLQEHAEITKQMTQIKQQSEYLELQLNESKSLVEKYLRDWELLYIKTQRVNEDFEQTNARAAALLRERTDLEKDNKLTHATVAKLTTDLSMAVNKHKREQKQSSKYRQMAEEARTAMTAAYGQTDRLEKVLEKQRHEEHQVQKVIDSLELQKEQQMRMTQRAEERGHKKDAQIIEKQRAIAALERELRTLREEMAEMKKTISHLQNERFCLQGEISEQKHETEHVVEAARVRDMKIQELQRKLTEAEGRHKHQQQLYESTRTDRNNYSKGLVEAQDEVVELKREGKVMRHQIEQLKQDVGTKDHALVREHFNFKEIEKQREQLRAEVSKVKQLISNNEQIIKQQDVEIQRLSRVLKKLDEEATLQRKEHDKVINERDILGTQLIRRNDELALLYEKLRIMQSTLEKGEAQYVLRVKDVRILRLKCMELGDRLSNQKSTGGNTDDLKRALARLQRELLQETNKVKALSEELENPINIHRWRKLEGSDPATYEMIQKIQTLQRRLICKTEEVVQRDQVLAEKEQLYLQIKAVLARQPGPEVAEQLGIYQSHLKEKTRQMKALAGELNMYQSQANEYRYEIEKLTRELQDIKRRYYEHKRRDQLSKEVLQAGKTKGLGKADLLVEQQAMAARKAQTRYVGGGFAVNR